MAMLVTMVVSIMLFDLTPTVQLFLGIVTASTSLALYYIKPSLLVAVEAPVVAKDEASAKFLPK